MVSPATRWSVGAKHRPRGGNRGRAPAGPEWPRASSHRPRRPRRPAAYARGGRRRARGPLAGDRRALGVAALVVLAPLAAGLAARAGIPALGRAEPEYAAGASLAIAALVYAAAQRDGGWGRSLGPPVIGAAAVLAASAAGGGVAPRARG